MNIKSIKLSFSTDHAAKKTQAIEIAFSFYLQMATDPQVQKILPQELGEKIKSARKRFEKQFAFLSDEDRSLYLKTPYVRLLCGPDLYKFFARLLSVNYQANKSLLSLRPGSVEEFFQEGAPFWNEKYIKSKPEGVKLKPVRDGLFFLACLNDQISRFQEKEALDKKMADHVKAVILDKDNRIRDLEAQNQNLQNEIDELKEQAQQKVVLVPSDPFYMLGLEKGAMDQVDNRTSSLIKVLHPDKSGTDDTAYLFDMVIKARDQIKRF